MPPMVEWLQIFVMLHWYAGDLQRDICLISRFSMWRLKGWRSKKVATILGAMLPHQSKILRAPLQCPPFSMFVFW